MGAVDLRDVRLLREMVRIRRFEERVADLVEAGEITTPCHLYIGQEAVAVGVCDVLADADTVWGGHRSHGHYLAKGGDLTAMMAEIFGRATGCSHGRGGSMHLYASEVGILGTVPLVAATIPLSVGAAFTARLRGTGEVAVAFFGDGATEEGHFHESMNLAALYDLPVIFACENNLYASHMSLAERRKADNIAMSGAAHGVPGVAVDGNDVLAVRRAAEEAVARARAGQGPTLLELRTYRWRGHVGPSWDMDVGVKRSGELQDWLARDPIQRFRDQLAVVGLSEEECERIEADAVAEVERAVELARTAPYPDVNEVTTHVFASRSDD